VILAPSKTILSVIVPAYNEAISLPFALEALRRAATKFRDDGAVEIIVVNDSSTDDTAAVATPLADRVVNGIHCGIGRARNVGAAAAQGAVLVFVDADTIVEEGVLAAIHAAWASAILAGAVVAVYESGNLLLKALFALWRWHATRKCMTQGVCQFFDRNLFEELGGYRSDLFMAEDTDLYSRARSLLKQRGLVSHCRVIDNVKVYPSMRRYEQWKSWRIVFWTNPWTTTLVRRSRWFWRHWYENPPR
jgi:glycosyltransferase involved in cell wall biosynthesis